MESEENFEKIGWWYARMQRSPAFPPPHTLRLPVPVPYACYATPSCEARAYGAAHDGTVGWHSGARGGGGEAAWEGTGTRAI